MTPQSSDRQVAVSSREVTLSAISSSQVVLVGAPNAGKSTLFNRLTGRSVKTVNYPGSTVELNWGRMLPGEDSPNDEAIAVVDTPGVYSLDPKSPEELVTLQTLQDMHSRATIADPRGPIHRQAVIVVLDATQLQRQLALVQQVAIQLRSEGEASTRSVPMILAITMLDLLDESLGPSAKIWSQLRLELGAQVVLLPRESTSVENESLQLLKSAVFVALSRSGSLPSQAEGSTSQGSGLVSNRREQIAQAKAWAAQLPSSHSISRLRERTRKIDAILLHPYWGWALLLVLMSSIFASVFWMATPMMDVIDRVFGDLTEFLQGIKVSSPSGQMAITFLAEGLVAGAGAVLVFVPQIFILFMILAGFEDSGYLARAASLLDRPLRAFGLGGRSFVPLLSGFACAVPAMMATRSINSPRERWLALFVLPLTSCSARLPVYALLLTLLFGSESSFWAGLALTGLFLGSIAVTLGASALTEKMGWWKREASFLIMELPPYRRPKVKNLVLISARRTQSYVLRTGPVIMVVSALLWGMTHFPNSGEADSRLQLESSYAGQIGQQIEPIFSPMGGDWRTGLGLITAFAAREVFVSSLAVIFVGSDTPNPGEAASGEGQSMTQLLGRIREEKNSDGLPLFTVSSVVGLIVFFMIALQCLSTFSVSWRESGSLTFAMIQLICFNLVAYGLSVGAVQGLRAIGVP